MIVFRLKNSKLGKTGSFINLCFYKVQ